MRRLPSSLLMGLLSGLVAAEPVIEVRGLMQDMAVLVIDGQQRLLRAGDRLGSVELLASDPRRAVLIVDGKRLELGLSERVGTHFVIPEQRRVQINRDAQGHFRVAGVIAGQPVYLLVDTGATLLAMSGRHADQLGIRYKAGGSPAQVVTAGGPALSYHVELDVVEVGGIQIRGVQAAVIEGDYPLEILLGMSFLRHVGLSEKAGVLTLTQDF